MTTQNVKTTWELAGKLAGSFETSTKRAQNQLGQLRQEYAANQAELRRMQTVLRTAAAGTTAYANASRRIPQLQEDISRQSFEIGDLQREILGGARAQDRMAGATGRAAQSLRGLVGFGLAAGGAIGITAGAAAALHSNLLNTAREAERLQTLSLRGIDTQSYQRASVAITALTGDYETARQAATNLTDVGRLLRENLAVNPRAISPEQLRGFGILGLTLEEARRLGQDVVQDMNDISDSILNVGLSADQAAGALRLAGFEQGLIDTMLELVDLKRRAAAGDAAAAAELDAYNERLERNAILSERAAEGAREYGKQIADLKLQFRATKNEAVQLALVDTGALQHLTNLLGGDFGALQDLTNVEGLIGSAVQSRGLDRRIRQMFGFGGSGADSGAYGSPRGTPTLEAMERALGGSGLSGQGGAQAGAFTDRRQVEQTNYFTLNGTSPDVADDIARLLGEQLGGIQW